MNFNSIYMNLTIPVVVCEADSLKISYINTEAKALLYVKINNRLDIFSDVILPRYKAEFDCLIQTMAIKGFVNDYYLTLNNFNEQKGTACDRIKINANTIDLSPDEDGKRYYCFYLFGEPVIGAEGKNNVEYELIRIFSAAYHQANTEQTIKTVLSLLGDTLNVSRVYIFENINNRYTCNTFEWCADGIEPMKETLQHVPLETFDHESFMSDTGMVLCNDTREMTGRDRASMERQGIKAILTVPFFDGSNPIGFIGCDECADYRKWSQFEIEILLNVSFIISSLVMRRKTQASAETAFQIMERVVDNIEAMVYVVNIETNRVIYMNSAMARERGIKNIEKEDLFCYQMFMRDASEPCEFCMSRRIANGESSQLGTQRVEFQSTINNKWYASSITAVEWINGEYVYLHSAVEITERKNNEDILKKSASIDSMTNVYNREWGYKSLDKLISDSKETDTTSAVIFIDVDGLKHVNDTYGHIEGDKIIIGIVNVLKKCTRKNDIIFRWGGDEFIILLPGCTKKNAESIILNANLLLSDINASSNKPYVYAFSSGIYEISGKDLYTADSVIRMADALMYEQKNRKKAERTVL